MRILTGHPNRHKVTICDGVHTNTWRVVEGTKTGTQTEAGTEKVTYNMYIQQHVNGYTKTHVGWYKVLKQRKRYIDTSNYICTVKQLHTNMYRQHQKRGHRVHGKTHIWEHWQPTKTPHSTTENCEEKTLNRGSPAGPLRPCTLGTPQLQNWEGRKDM